MSRGDFFTLERKKVTIYSDFLTSFDRNPTTDNLAINTNEAAVKRSLRNIVLTTCGERFYDSNKGTKIKGSLFELFDPASVEIMRLQLKEAIGKYEPRANPVNIEFAENIDGNSFSVQITFGIVNILDSIYSLEVNIKKIR